MNLDSDDQVILEKINLNIDGMTCQACASRIEKVLNRNEAIEYVHVNFASNSAQVIYKSDKTDIETIKKLIEKTGYTAQEKAKQFDKRIAKAPWRLIILWICTVPFIINMLFMVSTQNHHVIPIWTQWILATFVQFYLALHFYKSAWFSIKGKLANMDVLVILGTTSIWLLSTWSFFKNNSFIYFEASVMVIAFISLGKFLEEKVKYSQLNSLTLLLNLMPKKVIVIENGLAVEKKYQDIQIGDLVQAKIGDRICADGIIIDGRAVLDESHLTGEPKGIGKALEDQVLSGSLIQDGRILYQVKKLGSETFLGDMMSALDEAQGSKAVIARIADRVAGYFVPTVLFIALLTFLISWLYGVSFSQALINATSVLVIACPCALGLATPAAIMVGMGISSKSGIWFKNASAMEISAKINTIVLDKTGTLTKGEPEIKEIWLHPSSTLSEEKIWLITASIEQHSNHPIAKSFINKIEKQTSFLPVLNVKNTIGEGIEGDIDTIGHIKVGNLNYCQFELPTHLGKIWSISTIIAISINQKPIAVFALFDALKDKSKNTIAKIRKMGITPYIMSGDKQSAVNYIAKELSIPSEHAYGNMGPRDKASKIESLMNKGVVLAMVGDGINDAPALAIANIGFAMGNGSDVAKQTADITLLHHSIDDVYYACFIAKKTLRNIKQNLFFAFIYNIIGIPLAAIGYLTPVIAGAAMALSSISVILNALRLKNIKIIKKST